MASSLSEKEAGRALDAEVAEKVMGAKWEQAGPIDEHVCLMRGLPKPTHCLRLKLPPGVIYDTVTMAWRDASGVVHMPANAPGPHYSTEISAAFLVVSRMHELRWNVVVSSSLPYRGADENLDECTFTKYRDDEPPLTATAHDDDVALVICRAALLALESEQEGSR